MKIMIDAMGGDNAPGAFVEGAFLATKELNTDIVLIGKGELLLEEMARLGYDTLPPHVEIANADDMVDMHDDPATVVKTRKNSSMILGLKMLSEGTVDAFISAGNTGALLSGATLLVKRVKGIRRAAFGPTVPTATGHAVIIDAGANSECTPEFLLQFGCMGSFYAKKALGLAEPRVALLNNGTEDSKGDELHREAYRLLKEAGEKGTIRFVGNIEGRQVPMGDADVVVCDGFSGNVFLKTMEGTALFMAGMLKDIFKANIGSKVGYLLCQKGVKKLKKTMDYRETGGTMLVGISKPVIKAHGSSDALAVLGAVRQAISVVESGICDEIRENVEQMRLPKELEEHA